MTKELLAKQLNGREYGSELLSGEEQVAKKAGLVILFGGSDDLLEFRGAISDESYLSDEGTLLDQNGLLPSRDDIDDDDELEKFFARRKKAAKITALWCKEKDYSFTYKTDIPHVTFEIVEDGEPYCRGIVFELSALPK